MKPATRIAATLLLVLSAGACDDDPLTPVTAPTATVFGTAFCAGGGPAASSTAAIYLGRPIACNLAFGCSPTGAPLLSKSSVGTDGSFRLVVTMESISGGDFWILIDASDFPCLAGVYNFEQQPLPTLSEGQQLELHLIVSPFVI